MNARKEFMEAVGDLGEFPSLVQDTDLAASMARRAELEKQADFDANVMAG